MTFLRVLLRFIRVLTRAFARHAAMPITSPVVDDNLPMFVPPIYGGHEKFRKPESDLLDALLPRWNRFVIDKWVRPSTIASQKFGLRIKDAGFGRGFGLFNGNSMVIPKGFDVCYVSGILVRPDYTNSPMAKFETDSYAWIDFNTIDKDVHLWVRINSNPLKRTSNGSRYAKPCAHILHGCRPSCTLTFNDVAVSCAKNGTRLVLQMIYYVTLRDIEHGEELTVDCGRDYSMHRRFVHDSNSRECACEQGKCPFNRFVVL